MSIAKFLEKLKSSEIVYDTCGHDVYNLEESIKDRLEMYKDSKFSSVVELDDGTLVSRIESETCSNCGKRINFVKIKDNRVSIVEEDRYSDENNFKDYICSYDLSKKAMTAKILLKGNVSIVNFFKNIDVPEKDRYSSEYSLQSLAGRENHLKYFSSFNVGYGQTGNTSFSVYINKEKTNILFSVDTDFLEEELECGFPNEENKKRYESLLNKLKDYDYVGYISCEMWRYMFADKETINTLSLETDHYNSPVEIEEIPSGVWDFNHYYDLSHEDYPIIFGELTFEK